jgi:hypothetical protein
VLPFYDDVIISMQSHSLKLLIGENDVDMKGIKRKRMIELIEGLQDDDKFFFEKERNLLVVEYSTVEEDESAEYTYNDIRTESQGSQESRKRQREDDDVYNEIDESIRDVINKSFDSNNFNTDVKNKNKDD